MKRAVVGEIGGWREVGQSRCWSRVLSVRAGDAVGRVADEANLVARPGQEQVEGGGRGSRAGRARAAER